MKCLVTKLKEVADNDNLDILDGIVTTLKLATANRNLNAIFGFSGEVSITILTDGITFADGSKKIVTSRADKVTFNNNAGDIVKVKLIGCSNVLRINANNAYLLFLDLKLSEAYGKFTNVTTLEAATNPFIVNDISAYAKFMKLVLLDVKYSGNNGCVNDFVESCIKEGRSSGTIEFTGNGSTQIRTSSGNVKTSSSTKLKLEIMSSTRYKISVTAKGGASGINDGDSWTWSYNGSDWFVE